MSRRLKLRGFRLRHGLHVIVAGTPGVAPALADSLADRLAGAISSLRLRSAAADRPVAPAAPRPASPPVAVEPAGSQPGFDPFAFSLVADAIEGGEPRLRARLAGLAVASDLRALAKAQRLPADAAVLADPKASVDALKEVVIAAALQRATNRSAAAG